MSNTTAFAMSMVALLTALIALITSAASKPKPNPGDSARLAMIERSQRAILDHLGISVTEPDHPEVLELLMRGQKIQAIKAYREATGLGLKEAKDAVEEIARRNGM